MNPIIRDLRAEYLLTLTDDPYWDWRLSTGRLGSKVQCAVMKYLGRTKLAYAYDDIVLASERLIKNSEATRRRIQHYLETEPHIFAARSAQRIIKESKHSRA